jgi:excisionase family DNA binding protein
MNNLIDIRELSKMLHVSVSMLYAWISQGKIPYVKLGRLVRFDLQAVKKWLEEQSIEPKRRETAGKIHNGGR